MSPAVRGALWMSGAVLAFSIMAIAARELLRGMGTFEILFFRSLVMLAIVLAVLPARGAATLRSRRLGMHLVRNAFHFGGQFAWVYAIGMLPLATVFAIEFTMPVWTAALAALFLGERLNRGRLVMLALGLAGVALILRPGLAAIQPAALVMLAGSLCYAATMIATKRLTQTESPLAVLFWMAVIQTPAALAAAAPGWEWPGWGDAPWIAAVGAASFAAHYCIPRALKLADATVVVPIDFVRLPLIAVVGALLYGEPFDPAVLAGAAVIFAGTYYSLSREGRKA
jgi:drug/metabolite transporter (DMT)-like permease